MDQIGLPRSRRPVLLAAAVAAAAVMADPSAAIGATHARATTSRAGLAGQVIAYVTAAGTHTGTMTPIRTATNTALPAIKIGRSPQDIAVTPNGKTAYVVNFNIQSGKVTPIRTATNTALPPIKVGSFPLAIAVTP
jgi:DNA-binding beta-propeller fold protein YncE